jgi:hypothetical protein
VLALVAAAGAMLAVLASAANADTELLPRASISVDAPHQLVGAYAKLRPALDIGSMQQLDAKFRLMVYDAGGYVGQCDQWEDSCELEVTSFAAKSRTFRTYIALDGDKSTPPSNVGVSDPETVDWVSTLVLNTDSPWPRVGAYAKLTAKAATAPAGTSIQIWQLGARGGALSTCATSPCTAKVVAPMPVERKYYATQTFERSLSKYTTPPVTVTWFPWI